MKVLITGWFSFEQMGATAGDLMSRDVVTEWLDEFEIKYDIALASPFSGGVKWQTISAQDYSHIIFICGPFGNGEPLLDFLEKFKHCHFIGLNLSMLDPLEKWNPFELLIERDSSRKSNPDMTFLSNQLKVPVVGLILVEPQKEYKEKARHQKANDAIRELLNKKHCAVVDIDTRLDENRTGLRSAEEIESLIAKMDIVVTTRLHGTVLAIKNSVPSLSIDPISGGAKISIQASTIGWPIVFKTEELNIHELSKAFDYCLSQDARDIAKECKNTALKKLAYVKQELLNHLIINKEIENHG